MKYSKNDYSHSKYLLVNWIKKSPDRSRELIIAELSAMTWVPLSVWYHFLIEIEGPSEAILARIKELEE